MANPKMQVEASIVLDSSYVRIKPNKETRSEVKALLHLEAAAAVQRGDNIRIPIPVAVVVGCAQDEATREFTFKTEMWELILGKFRPANGNDDIIVIAGNSCIKLMSELISSPQDNPMAECVTDLKPVLKVAIKELNKPRPSSVVGTGQRGFIILVSDGGSEFTKDDEYEAFCKDLSEYPVHAFGLGFGNNQHDLEWEVLQRIVSISKGTFSYIPVTDDREKLDRDVVQGIASCLGGLATVVAMDMRVKITCVPTEKTNCIKNLKIEKIQSGGFDSSITSKQVSVGYLSEGEVSVGYLSEGEAKDLIVHVAFKSDDHHHTDTRWLKLIATVEYDYYHYNSGSSSCWHKQKQPSEKRIEVRRACDEASYKEYETWSKQPNPEVLEQMIRSDVVQMLHRFAAEGSQGGSKEKSAEDLRGRWEELKQPEGGNLQMGARLRMTRDLIRRIGMDIEAMALSLERGCGLGCIYSWVSSNEMQRATTTSLPPPAAASPFLTPAMKEAARNVSKHYLVAAAKKEPQAPPPTGAAPAGSSSSSPAAQPGGTRTTTLDDDTKRQRGKKLLDFLVPLLVLEQKDKIGLQPVPSSTSNDKSDDAIKFLNFWTKFKEVVEAVTNDATQMPTSPTTTEVVDDHLKDGIAKWLFDRIVIELNKNGSSREHLEKIYEVAKEATSMWKKICEDHSH